MKPGDQIERRFEVTNQSSSTREVELYPAAATVTTDGFTFAEENRAGNELTEWISFDRETLTLDADERAEVRATITVPRDATGGEHYGVLWAELRPDRDRTAGVISIGRAGIRVYLSVGPGGEPRSDFTVGPLAGARTADGAPRVTASVRNTGGRALDLVGELMLTGGPGGISVGPVPLKLETIGVGDTRRLEIPLHVAVPDARWQAELTLTGSRVTREASGTVTFGASEPDRSAQARSTTGKLVAYLGTASLLVVAMLGFYTYRRRAR